MDQNDCFINNPKNSSSSNNQQPSSSLLHINRQKRPLKPYSFKSLINTTKSEPLLEEVINKDPLEMSRSYSESDFGIDDNLNPDKLRKNPPIKLLKINLLETYQKIKPNYLIEEEESEIPKRALTIPEEGVNNNGKDNVYNNLIVYVSDEIKSQKGTYIIIDLLGQGISGQVFKCFNKQNNEYYALKIIKCKKVFLNQALIELKLLGILNNDIDINDKYHIIRIIDYFYHFEHLCIVFELLNKNLYELLKQKYLQGLALSSIRFIIKDILVAVEQFHKANIIHCDLKPENILLKIDKNTKEISVKVTDFGSACMKGHTIFKYIQSRYYRAPEVILGLPYSTEIDIWSVGCIAAELYLGRPLFPGSCEFDQLRKIIEVLGNIPDQLIFEGKNCQKYFKYDKDIGKLVIKSEEEFYKEYPKFPKSKYNIPYGIKTLDDLNDVKRDSFVTKQNDSSLNNSNIINNSSSINYSFNSSGFLGPDDLKAFIHFLKGLLQINPKKRWNAKQCLRHPFITKEKIDSFLSYCPDEISTFIYLSGQESTNSNIIPKNKMFNSFMVNNSYCNYNNNILGNNSFNYDCNSNSQNKNINCNFNSNSNLSFDMNAFVPNLNNVKMKNFPFVMNDQLFVQNTQNNFYKGKNNTNNNSLRMNNTYMATSFERINTSNDYNYYFKQNMNQYQNNVINSNYLINNQYVGQNPNNSYYNGNGFNNAQINFKNDYMRNSFNKNNQKTKRESNKSGWSSQNNMGMNEH